jgi:hypothetical protein
VRGIPSDSEKRRMSRAWKAGTLVEEMAQRFGYRSKASLWGALVRLQKTDPKMFPRRKKR